MIIGNSGPSLLAFIRKGQKGEYIASPQLHSASVHFTIKYLLLSNHHGAVKAMLLYIYIVLLDFGLNWLSLKAKIRTTSTVSICQTTALCTPPSCGVYRQRNKRRCAWSDSLQPRCRQPDDETNTVAEESRHGFESQFCH